uniref:Salivary secreted protein n=1 Tax=Macrostomum lignano TaxID=282301 RepID=A0A1I8HFB1_9PLAT
GLSVSNYLNNLARIFFAANANWLKTISIPFRSISSALPAAEFRIGWEHSYTRTGKLCRRLLKKLRKQTQDTERHQLFNLLLLISTKQGPTAMAQPGMLISVSFAILVLMLVTNGTHGLFNEDKRGYYWPGMWNFRNADKRGYYWPGMWNFRNADKRGYYWPGMWNFRNADKRGYYWPGMWNFRNADKRGYYWPG